MRMSHQKTTDYGLRITAYHSPQKEGQPAEQKDAHDDAQGAGGLVFRLPSFGRSHGAACGGR